MSYITLLECPFCFKDETFIILVVNDRIICFSSMCMVLNL